MIKRNMIFFISSPCIHKHGRFSIQNPSICQIKAHLATQAASKRVFIFGLGYVGSRIADKIINACDDIDVAGTCRQNEIPEIQTKCACHVFDPSRQCLLDDAGIQSLLNATHIISTIPPCRDTGIDVVLNCYNDLMRSELQNIKWMAYASTTSVYGDHKGKWVDETSSLLSSSKMSQQRIVCEKKWQSMGPVRADVFRFAGIYGPNRNALEILLKIKDPNQKCKPISFLQNRYMYTSRIFVDDIARIIMAAIKLDITSTGDIYNIADDSPTTKNDVFKYAASKIGVTLGALERQSLSVSKHTENDGVFRTRDENRQDKKVANTKMKKRFSIELLYPSYIQGIDHLYDTYNASKIRENIT